MIKVHYICYIGGHRGIDSNTTDHTVDSYQEKGTEGEEAKRKLPTAKQLQKLLDSPEDKEATNLTLNIIPDLPDSVPPDLTLPYSTQPCLFYFTLVTVTYVRDAKMTYQTRAKSACLVNQ